MAWHNGSRFNAAGQPNKPLISAYAVEANRLSRRVRWRGPHVDQGSTWATDFSKGWLTKDMALAQEMIERYELAPARVVQVRVEEVPLFEPPPPRPEPSLSQRVHELLEGGSRSTELLRLLEAELADRGELELRAPRDKKMATSLRERVYTAARRRGIKVSVSVKDGRMRAVVRT